VLETFFPLEIDAKDCEARIWELYNTVSQAKRRSRQIGFHSIEGLDVIASTGTGIG